MGTHNPNWRTNKKDTHTLWVRTLVAAHVSNLMAMATTVLRRGRLHQGGVRLHPSYPRLYPRLYQPRNSLISLWTLPNSMLRKLCRGSHRFRWTTRSLTGFEDCKSMGPCLISVKKTNLSQAISPTHEKCIGKNFGNFSFVCIVKISRKISQKS